MMRLDQVSYVGSLCWADPVVDDAYAVHVLPKQVLVVLQSFLPSCFLDSLTRCLIIRVRPPFPRLVSYNDAIDLQANYNVMQMPQLNTAPVHHDLCPTDHRSIDISSYEPHSMLNQS